MAPYLPEEPARAALLRLDAARILKRFFHLERTLIVACAGWVPAVHGLDSKEHLARAAWENASTAQALRARVFELRYPDRSLDVGADHSIVQLFEAALHAPSGGALLAALAEVLLPWQGAAYDAYLRASDDIADGPTQRFLALASTEKVRQQHDLRGAAQAELSLAPSDRDVATAWVDNLRATLSRVGAPGLDPPSRVDVPRIVAPGTEFELAQDPGRDARYHVCSFYWPDIVDPGWDYGRGLQLQLRSAVSHLNEVWAVDTAGAILHGLAPSLGWDFVFDAARWLYDESRHMAMGRQRLQWWGLSSDRVPLGSYIYEACRGQDPVHRLGMLAFFETKNIGRKRHRADALGRLGDRTSQRDMDFDWADEAIHAGYGRRWLRRALEATGGDGVRWPEVVDRCERLVAARVAQATHAEIAAIKACATELIRRAEELAHAGHST